MAKKKENKAIGYVILSFIPLFGIVMAAVEGIQHSGFVKEARAAELKFEEKFFISPKCTKGRALPNVKK